ncbi:MAG: T9SS type A sorting domain-containing protein [Flavobacteriales bacterium]|nr:T9SS type A sorting domain-containing protein [Flavobacteriales bacterium]
MKKTLLTLSILISCLMISNAQCTPNPIFTFLGIPAVYPPNIPLPNIPLNGISDGQVNVPYSQTLTLIVLEDTTLDIAPILQLGGFGAAVTLMNAAGISTVMTVDVNHVTYDITGLPNSISYVCDISTCQYPSGVDGCMQISGTPTQSGTFPIDVNMTINIQIPPITDPVLGTTIFAGMPVDLPSFPGQQYDLFIDGSSSIVNREIEEIIIYPNPTSNISILEFEGIRNIKVLDNLGRIIFSKKDVNSTLKLSKDKLGTGLFIIEILNETKIIKQKLIIN